MKNYIGSGRVFIFRQINEKRRLKSAPHSHSTANWALFNSQRRLLDAGFEINTVKRAYEALHSFLDELTSCIWNAEVREALFDSIQHIKSRNGEYRFKVCLTRQQVEILFCIAW